MRASVAVVVSCVVVGWLVGVTAHAADREMPKPETNSIGMLLQRVPAGEFRMGNHDTPESLQAAFPQYPAERITMLVDEVPAHRVRITRPFGVGVHEVTIAQFRQFAEQAPFKTEAETDGKGGWGYNREKGEFEGRDLKYSWRNPGFPQGDDHPVVNVTWNDAVAFCEWLGKKEGRRYRLPTEAEWEYCCRAGTTTRFHSGDDPDQVTKAANVYDATTRELFPEWTPFATKSSDKTPFTSPVGKFAANAFGLHDMHGNVWEWCSDWHGDDYYSKSPVDDPQGPETGKVRVRRGGSWHTWAFYCRSSFRNWNSPRTRYVLVGFRVVREEAAP